MQKRKYVRHAWLLIAGLVALLAYAISLSSVVAAVSDSILTNQYLMIRKTVNLMCDYIDTCISKGADWRQYDYSYIIASFTTRLDSDPGVFAALYDGRLNLISERVTSDSETPIFPHFDTSFVSAISHNERGELTSPYISLEGRSESMYLYYRWIPSGNEYDRRLLLVAAIGPNSIEGSPARTLVSWCIGLLAVSSIVVITAGVISAMTPRRGEEAAPRERE